MPLLIKASIRFPLLDNFVSSPRYYTRNSYLLKQILSLFTISAYQRFANVAGKYSQYYYSAIQIANRIFVLPSARYRLGRFIEQINCSSYKMKCCSWEESWGKKYARCCDQSFPFIKFFEDGKLKFIDKCISLERIKRFLNIHKI